MLIDPEEAPDHDCTRHLRCGSELKNGGENIMLSELICVMCGAPVTEEYMYSGIFSTEELIENP